MMPTQKLKDRCENTFALNALQVQILNKKTNKISGIYI